MLKFGFEYSFYIFAEYLNIWKNEPIFPMAINICNDVIQALWFLNLLIIQISKVLQLVSTDPSTINEVTVLLAVQKH